jgi:hypothetical protein
VDKTVWGLYGDKMKAWAESVSIDLEPVVAAANEDHKTLETFTYMLDELKRVDPLRRSEPVLAVGGGVLTDTAGFACACWRRGIPWCRLPTTLLGIVDASVGIKVRRARAPRSAPRVPCTVPAALRWMPHAPERLTQPHVTHPIRCASGGDQLPPQERRGPFLLATAHVC